ncbi:DUF4276 family protein [Dokdonella sp.]|uniref:DUF4276 family protein n=1 Tax=Dokdonella sp. TaxID=2291710 RepID=UPI003BB0335D
MTTLVFLLEEPSAKAMLEGLLPRFLTPEINVRYVPFEGKQDLHRQLERKLRGWLTPSTRFVVLRDQDSAGCIDVKHEIAEICRRAGKPETLVRIACHELESFYLGDLQAVAGALGIGGLAGLQDTHKFRSPDRLSNPSDELRRITNGRYQKIAGSRAIGPCLRLDDGSRSNSFRVLVSGIRRVAQDLVGAQ